VAKLAQLPDSCAASAAELERQRAIYESGGVFDKRMVDAQAAMLREFDDAGIRDRVKANPELMKELVAKYYYCG
jgi:glutamine synthetase